MDPILILGLVLAGILAGLLGTLFGLGGGTILIPVLVILYDLPPAEAAAISLVGIISASVYASSFLIENRVSNIRLALLFEIPTAIGAIFGAAMAIFVDGVWLIVLFVTVMVYSGIRMLIGKEHYVTTSKPEEGKYEYYDMFQKRYYGYDVKNVGSGSAAFLFAGMVSSMTGIGGGAIKVPVMNIHMNVPIKAATATSSYMIGITALSGAIMYLIQGTMILEYAALVALGSFFGSILGSHISKFIPSVPLRRYFSLILFVLAAIMTMNVTGVL